MTGLMLPATQKAGRKPKSARHTVIPAAVGAPDLHSAELLASATWKVLAPLMAARPTMRLWNPGVRFNEAADLTKALPDKPAAVPLFRRNRTRLIALDLDAKQFGAQAVADDLAALRTLLRDCDATVVVDRSTSGGAHVLIPLQTAVTKDELVGLLAALAMRYRTLDLKPMQNDSAFGCITVPGSRCRDGGFRVLVGSLGAAGQAFRRRNAAGVLERISAELGGPELLVDLAADGVAGGPDSGDADSYLVGVGRHRRLRDEFTLGAPVPTVVEAFAAEGSMPRDGRWPSASEARQSVLYHAVGRGLSLADVQQRMARGARWQRGMGAAYARYRHERTWVSALERDWAKALALHVARCRSFHGRTHKTEHTGGALRSPAHALWLAHAVRWCDTTLRGAPGRWSVAAVLQALAVHGVRSGERVNGTETVAVGVRALSLASGLLSKETVAVGLQLLREWPGSPVLQVQETDGTRPDGYALVTPDVVDVDPGGPGRPRLAEVHDAWWVLGVAHRRIYEMLEDAGRAGARDLAVASRMSLSAAYESLAELCRRGLVRRCRTGYALGERTLDDVARDWRVEEERRRRIESYRRERKQWREFLKGRHAIPVVEVCAAGWAEPVMDVVLSVFDERDYENAVMAHGPPTSFDELPVARLARGARRHRQWWVN